MSEQPKNPAVDLAEAAAKKLIMDVLLEKAIGLAIKEAAWLAMPVINPIFTLIMKFAAKYLYKVLSLEAAFIIIGKQVETQRENYEREIEQLKTAIKEGKSDEEIAKERAEAKERLRALINFNVG
jgi:cell shape-determining protein MreC